MNTNFKFASLILFSFVLIFSSCKKEPGCMDPNSMTYNPEAQKDDGSCIYAYDIAQGIWNIDPDCDDITIPIVNITISLTDQLPESIEVQGAGDNSLFIDIDGTQVSGDIDNDGNITVPEQTVSLDPTGTGVPIPVNIEGDGKIELDNSGQMSLTYNFDFQGFPLSSSCSITLSK
ncbi:MAG: hypothetical protein ACKVG7_03945 [Flavobacteriales bacterium]